MFLATSRVDHLPALLIPNYEVSIKKVMRDATIYLVFESRSLDILEGSSTPIKSNIDGPKLPSWVFSFQRSMTRMGRPMRFDDQYTCANNTTPCICQEVAGDPDVLSVLGIPVGKTTSLTSTFDHETFDSVEVFEAGVRKMYELLNESDIVCDQQRLGRTLICDHRGYETRVSKNVCLGLQDWLAYLSLNRELPPRPWRLQQSNQTYDEQTWRASMYNYDICRGLLNRRFFIASNDVIGVGPPQMLVGDIIVILYGCRWPVVLRSRGEQYEVI